MRSLSLYGPGWAGWLSKRDGILAPLPDESGHGAVHVLAERVTLLAWWDRSIDSRGGSNSMLLADGQHSFERMVEVLEWLYPEVADRQLGEIHKGVR